MKGKVIKIGTVSVANNLPFILIGGPDSLESSHHAIFMARQIKKICQELSIPYIFKASYDKANRTSIGSFRGLGLDGGKKIFQKIKDSLHIPITTDIHSPDQATQIANFVDLIQIPALLSRQTDLIVAAAKTKKAVNIKKGQFMAPEDIRGIIGKAISAKNNNVLMTERGTMFGYRNLVVDMRSLEIMKQTGYPVIFDASHSVQLPSAGDKHSLGQREFIPALARAAVAVGVAGIFMEIHDKPDKAPVDGQNSLVLKDLKQLLTTLKKIDRSVKGY